MHISIYMAVLQHHAPHSHSCQEQRLVFGQTFAGSTPITLVELSLKLVHFLT